MCNTVSRLRVSGLGLVVALGTMLGGGCSVEIGPNPGQPGGTNPPSNDDLETVTLRFVNLATDLGVDLEFYASNEPLDVVPDDLFVEENLVTEGLGFLGSGTLGPLWEDSIDFPCTEELTIGTRGGTFRDTDSNREMDQRVSARLLTCQWTCHVRGGRGLVRRKSRTKASLSG